MTPTPASPISCAKICASVAPAKVILSDFPVAVSTSFFNMRSVAIISALCVSMTNGKSPYEHIDQLDGTESYKVSGYTFNTRFTQYPSSPFLLSKSNLRRALTCVLTLGLPPEGPMAKCSAATFWRTAPSSSLCDAPVEK